MYFKNLTFKTGGESKNVMIQRLSRMMNIGFTQLN